jgi:hypothetical protein
MKTLHFVFAFCLAGTAYGQLPDREVELGSVQSEGGPTRTFAVTATRLSKTPTWSPGKGWPPVSLDQALTTAQQWISKVNPKLERFSPMDIRLSCAYPNLGVAGERRWFWSITFDAFLGEYTLGGGPLEAVVLMDGSIVEPRITRLRAETSQ